MEENDAHKAAKDDTLSICGETMHFFPELRDWILTTLHAEHSIVAFKDKAPTHHFLVSVMKLVQSLVLFGYYTNTKDIIQLMKAIFDILDGRTDRHLEKHEDADDLEHWRKFGRFHNSAANKVVFEIKHEGLVVVELLFNFKISELLNQFLLDFKNLLPHVETYKAKREFSRFSRTDHLPHMRVFFLS